MKSTTAILLALGCWGLHVASQADVLELKNGTILNGTYAGGTAGTVRFNTASGVQAFETSQILALTFTTTNRSGAASAGTPGAAAAPAAATKVAPTGPTQAITLPTGTTLLVRTMDSISSKNKAGTKFATRLEYDLSAGNAVALKGGTPIYGQVQTSTEARRAVGRSTLDLRLTQIVAGGQTVSISTSGFQEAGQASINKAAKGAAAGAAIGAIAGDAGKGAAIGAGAGAIVRGQTVTVPPGTLLEFTLTQPVTLPPAP